MELLIARVIGLMKVEGREEEERRETETERERGDRQGKTRFEGSQEVSWGRGLLESSPAFFPLAWLERRLAGRAPEGLSALCLPFHPLALLTPALLTFQSDHIPGKLGRNHCTNLRPYLHLHPKGGGSRSLNPKHQTQETAREPCLSSQNRLHSSRGTPEDQQLSPPSPVCLPPSPSRWSSDGAKESRRGSGARGPRKPPGLRVRWEGTPGSRATPPPRPAPESLRRPRAPASARVPAAAARRRTERGGGPGGGGGGGAACLALRQIRSLLAREPRLPARRPSAPPEPPPGGAARAARARRRASRRPPPPCRPCAPLRGRPRRLRGCRGPRRRRKHGPARRGCSAGDQQL